MQYLFKRWQKIKDLVRGTESVFLLLDYDGTLTSIKTRPHLAKLSIRTKKLLKNLANNPFFKLAIISGRPLKEIKRLIGIKDIIYAGNHGLELQGPKIKFINERALSNKSMLNQIYKKLRGQLSCVKGVFVENKGLTLSIHFRLVNKKDIEKMKLILRRLLKPLVVKKKIRITYGKMVYEIRPPVNWGKGRIVNWLLRCHSIVKPKTLPICIGDDQTDEDMFKAIGTRGISVCVGKANFASCAGYYLRNTEEVKRFLGKLNTLTK